MLVDGTQLAHPWAFATMHCGSGWTAADFLTALQSYVKVNEKFKTPDGNGRYLFPTSMPCAVFDNLNACFDNQQKGQSKYCGLRADKE
eukprot:2082313-Heterocapsa_arctica.AAC.1